MTCVAAGLTLALRSYYLVEGQLPASLEQLGGETWFRLGDRDLALHVERTRRLAAGQRLSEVTGDLARRLGVDAAILPMSDETVATRVHTVEHGVLPFQEYFVKLGCAPTVTRFEFAGVHEARPAPGVSEAAQRHHARRVP